MPNPDVTTSSFRKSEIAMCVIILEWMQSGSQFFSGGNGAIAHKIQTESFRGSQVFVSVLQTGIHPPKDDQSGMTGRPKGEQD
jgi:hypothetical protein